MPTLVMSDQFSAPEKSILLKTFNFCCREYGIQNKDASVFLRRNFFTNSRLRGRMTRMGEKDFMIELSGSEGIVDNGSVLTHETTHVGQYLKGKLIDDSRGEIDGGCFWEGEYFPRSVCNSMIAYRTLPWEIEAHANQDALTMRAWLHLDEKDREFMLGETIRDMDKSGAEFSVPGVPDWFVQKLRQQYLSKGSHGNGS